MRKKSFCLFAVLAMLFCFTTSCGDGFVDYDIYGSISGIVIDRDTHEPIQSAYVSIIPGSTNTYTGYDGSFEFTGLIGGVNYTVQAQYEGYLAGRKSTTVIAGDNVNIDLLLEKKQK